MQAMHASLCFLHSFLEGRESQQNGFNVFNWIRYCLLCSVSADGLTSYLIMSH